MHILSSETDNCPSWISGRERMTVENISWSISTKESCRPRRGLNPRPPGLQSDGASNWATEAGTYDVDTPFYMELRITMLCIFSCRNKKELISNHFTWLLIIFFLFLYENIHCELSRLELVKFKHMMQALFFFLSLERLLNWFVCVEGQWGHFKCVVSLPNNTFTGQA